MSPKIKELPKNERPRERLLHHGVEFLNNEELLSIIIKTGTKDYSAKELASNILKLVDRIQDLKNISINKLMKIKGIGQTKACEIIALIELTKRINQDIETIHNVKINSSDLVFNYYKEILKDQKQEQFYCLYLDSSNKVLKSSLLFMGTINKSNVYPREIFKEAYLLGATAIICVHNHPSGNIKPSMDDINITKSIKEIGNMMGVKLLDHVIIGKNSYYSFLENGNI